MPAILALLLCTRKGAEVAATHPSPPARRELAAKAGVNDHEQLASLLQMTYDGGNPAIAGPAREVRNALQRLGIAATG